MKTIILFCIGVLLLAPALSYGANLPKDDLRPLYGQVTALATYVERTFLPRSTISNTQIRTHISDGVRWLENAQENNGHFRYEYLPLEDIYREGDNIVRQAGTLYSLGEIVRQDTNDIYKVDAVAEKSIEYLVGLTKEGKWGNISFLCVSSGETSTECKLGATSLALIGILGYLEAHPEKADIYESYIEGYISFITAMRLEGQGFRDRFRIGASTQNDKESGFSNGEALYALARYQRMHEDANVKNTIQEVYTYIQGQEFESTKYLWVMAALKDMQKIWPDQDYTTYAQSFTDWRIRGVLPHKKTKNNYCAYSEGITSAYKVLESTLDDIEKQRLELEIDFWNAKNAYLQIDPTESWRVMETGNTLALKEIPDRKMAAGGFLTSHTEPAERIDFTQHCITAYTQTLTDVRREPL